MRATILLATLTSTLVPLAMAQPAMADHRAVRHLHEQYRHQREALDDAYHAQRDQLRHWHDHEREHLEHELRTARLGTPHGSPRVHLERVFRERREALRLDYNHQRDALRNRWQAQRDHLQHAYRAARHQAQAGHYVHLPSHAGLSIAPRPLHEPALQRPPVHYYEPIPHREHIDYGHEFRGARRPVLETLLRELLD
jgi:hypothetical protein